MIVWLKKLAIAGVLGILLASGNVLPSTPAHAESEGLADLDEAMRIKVTAEGLRDLNKAIELLQSALDKGLEVEDAEMAENMLSDALMERANSLMQVINSRSIQDDRVKQIVRLVISDLRRVLAYDNPPPMAYFHLGRLMAFPGGDPHEARRLLSTFLNAEDISEDQKAEALMMRARVQTDEAKAMEDFDAAIELVPENASYRLVRAMFLRSQDRFEDALKAVDEVLENEPQDANAFILQGEVLREMGKLDEALESFDEAAELAPQAPDPYQNRGEIYREREEFEKAITQFTKVLELQPGSLLPLVHRAEAYLNNGQLEEALADVELVLEEQSLVAAHRLRAEVLAQMNRIDDAIAEIEQIASAEPTQIELKMQLALYYLVDKKPSKAITAYTDVLNVDSENFLALRSRGDAYLNLGKHAEAIEDFEKALKLQSDDPALLNNLAWVLATSPDEEVRDGDRAIDLATKACELTNYNKPHILSTLAAAFAESGNFDSAIEWSQKAVNMDDPEHSDQLKQELASYKQGQPWRERQTVADRGEDQPPRNTSPDRVEAPPQSLDF